MLSNELVSAEVYPQIFQLLQEVRPARSEATEANDRLDALQPRLEAAEADLASARKESKKLKKEVRAAKKSVAELRATVAGEGKKLSVFFDAVRYTRVDKYPIDLRHADRTDCKIIHGGID